MSKKGAAILIAVFSIIIIALLIVIIVLLLPKKDQTSMDIVPEMLEESNHQDTSKGDPSIDDIFEAVSPIDTTYTKYVLNLESMNITHQEFSDDKKTVYLTCDVIARNSFLEYDVTYELTLTKNKKTWGVHSFGIPSHKIFAYAGPEVETVRSKIQEDGYEIIEIINENYDPIYSVNFFEYRVRKGDGEQKYTYTALVSCAWSETSSWIMNISYSLEDTIENFEMQLAESVEWTDNEVLRRYYSFDGNVGPLRDIITFYSVDNIVVILDQYDGMTAEELSNRYADLAKIDKNNGIVIVIVGNDMSVLVFGSELSQYITESNIENAKQIVPDIYDGAGGLKADYFAPIWAALTAK